jgi:tetratricopeptide (TPR) repeat protein
MLRAALVVATLIVACVGTSSRAHAQNQAEMEARRLFRLGQAHYENGQFEEAARTFEEAYRLSPLPRLMFNAYLAYRDMQDLPNSSRTLRLFLENETDLEPSERDQLTARLAAIDAAIARTGGNPTNTTQVVATTENNTTTITAETETTTDSGGGFNPSPVGFIIGGVGIALEIVAIITGVMANSELSTLEGRCPNDLCPDDQALRDAQSRGQTLAIVTDIMWPTGLVAIGVGVALIFALQEGGNDSNTTAGFSCTPEGCYGAVRSTF